MNLPAYCIVLDTWASGNHCTPNLQLAWEGSPASLSNLRIGSLIQSLGVDAGMGS